MKKNATMEEKIEAIVKALLKQYKTSKDGCISITGYFNDEYRMKTNQRLMIFECGKTRIEFDEMSGSSFGDFTCRIGEKVCAILGKKMKKNEVIIRHTDEKWTSGHGLWSMGHSYVVFNGIKIVKTCRGFAVINKKIVKLGLAPINVKDWYVDYVGGKRSHIYSHDVHYYAESEDMCAKVLDYIKGKKKLSYEFFEDDDLDARKYGERFETEWEGRMSRKIAFKDFRGHVTKIY